MARRTKADRQAAAKKGAATKQQAAAKKGGADAKRSAKTTGTTALAGAKSLAEFARQTGKAISNRVGAARRAR